MANRPLPSQEALCQLLRYETESGKLFWKERSIDWFNDEKQSREHNAAIWNGKNAGKEAFTTALPHGHRYASLHKQKFLAHRVIWKMVYGNEPVGIDHIDGDPSNNRLDNLREAMPVVNGKNIKLKRNNTSGVMGVRWEQSRSKWIARINVNYQSIHLGVFDTFDAAVAARKVAEREYGFHPNHGRAT